MLVLAGVVVFPMLFDTQPRPIPVDIPIEIPSRDAAHAFAKPTELPARVSTDGSLAPKEEAVVSSPHVGLPTDQDHKDEPVRSSRPEPVQATPVTAAPKATAVAETVNPQRVAPVDTESARAQALLDGKDATAAASASERFIVQVGAFADATLAQQTRLKLERAGMKTYTHVANTPDGKRTRVRLGPFASRADAEKAAAKARSLGINSAILTL